MSGQLGVILGVHVETGMTPELESLEESIFRSTRALLDSTDVDDEWIDGVVTASSDLIDGRAISVMVTSGSVAGPGRDTVNVSSSGEHALVWAAARAAAGTHDLQIVAAWARPSEAPMSEIEQLILDPIYTRSLHPTTADFRALARSRTGGVATSESSLAPLADAIVVLVLASARWCAERERAGTAVTGVGWISGSYLLADRLQQPMSSTLAAVTSALGRAERRLDECDALLWDLRDDREVADVARGLRLTERGGSIESLSTPRGPHRWRPDIDTRFVNGMLNVAAAVDRVPAGGVALVHAQSGIAGQSASAFVLERS